MLGFLTAAFERVIVRDYQDILLAKARDVERRLSEVDHVLTACDRCSAMDGLADRISAVHASLADLLSSLADRTGALVIRKGAPGQTLDHAEG
jgi:hypothetical protein